MSKRRPVITVVDLDTADREYPVTIPAGTKSYTIKTRGNNAFKLAYKTGQVDNTTGDFISVPAGSAESEDGLSSESNIVLYVSCEKGSEKAEVKTWR